ncbi:transcriptional attenuator, LytR family [Clostridium aceticum]|uniref:Transcriptional attenuator, LytR family n=1 Tax=Clostridium aceticum TaxID=84022 RepID=A0A0D8IDD2_9CLOT|nr:LCP family protein [Clostridium aceticum]AKL93617.1 transcriptional attenuator, LytR family [Clostridium aceticum]KJF27201.1 transcriptional regulator [Clostridium aceticum]
MKVFLKVFTIAFTSFVILFTGAFVSFNTFMKDKHPSAEVPVIVRPEDDDHFEDTEPEIKDELLRAVAESNRINFIMLGLEGMRSDTMMFVSFDPENKGLDIISIPRDTYYPRVGYDGPGKKKINAAYGDHGAAGVKTVVSDLLFDVPVHHYVTVTYKGAAAIVNAIGGVPVTIPRGGMHYRDDYDDPPLVINFPAGPRVLNGEDAVKFLRYRQPTPGSGAVDRGGDLGRIGAQQEFMQSALQKAMSLGSLPNLVSTSFRHVRTDIELQDVLRYATNAVGLNMENVSMTMLPGTARYQNRVSYYFHDQIETRNLLLEIYGVKQEEQSPIEEE